MSGNMVGAVVLAAGQSKRMGQPKMVLPWGRGTVIEQVVQVLVECHISPIVVVTGGAHEEVINALRKFPVILVHNERYEQTEMLQSLQLGLVALPKEVQASLVVLGDQPQIGADVVTEVFNRFKGSQSPLIVPSYQMRRGHPWLVARKYWDEILHMSQHESLRNFLTVHALEIDYLVVDTPSILADLDTPQDYQREKPI